jgi:hypothetical protein
MCVSASVKVRQFAEPAVRLGLAEAAEALTHTDALIEVRRLFEWVVPPVEECSHSELFPRFKNRVGASGASVRPPPMARNRREPLCFLLQGGTDALCGTDFVHRLVEGVMRDMARRHACYSATEHHARCWRGASPPGLAPTASARNS